MFDYPEFNKLDIKKYPVLDGYYTLGFLQQHRPDCVFVTYHQWQHYHDYDWLDQTIKQHLDQKIVCILPWDEDVIGEDKSGLFQVINQYYNEQVYWLCQLSPENQQIYSGLKCKILELPWWLLNDVLTYYEAKKLLKELLPPPQNQYNYLCMIGNSYSSHKTWLIDKLISSKLHDYGLITVLRYSDHPRHLRDYITENPCPPYQNCNTKWPKMAAQEKIGDLWISANVRNYLHIEQTYDMPLIINAETTPGIFQPSEKSIWPALLGRMYLIYGSPGIMSWIQQWHDVDQTDFAEIGFDNIMGHYTEQDYRDRLDVMIDSNIGLITHAREIYQDLKPSLESSRSRFGQKLYDFFIGQIQKIK